MLSRFNKLYLLFFIIFISSCFDEKSDNVKQKQENFSLDYPNGFPEINFPSDNHLSISRVQLGEKLFFDPILSLDSSISCATCHQPKFAFADTNSITKGIYSRKGFRNVPSILNVAYFNTFMLDGGVPTLEIQVVHPLTDTNEMGMGINQVVARLKKSQEYEKLSYESYGRELDAYVVTRSLSAFERTLLSGNSKYDKYKEQGGNIFSESEKRGMELFFGNELNCSKCHDGFLFTNQSYQNNGVKENYLGDTGRERVTHKKEDEGKFKVPSLRNVNVTPPYMHDGSFENLEEVIEHYNSGGVNHANKSDLIRPLNLTEIQKNDLKAFLETLTDEKYHN